MELESPKKFLSPIISYKMKLTTINFILLALYIQLQLSPSVHALKCYVCESKNNIDCVEKLPDDHKLQPQSCDNIAGARYCIKTTGIHAGELGTKRFCAANDHGNYCSYLKQPTGDREHRGCEYTCESDLCNGANSLSSSNLQSTLTLSAALVLTVMNRWLL